MADQDERDGSYVRLFTNARTEHISTHFGHIKVRYHQVHMLLAVNLKRLDSGRGQQNLEILPVAQALPFIKKLAGGIYQQNFLHGGFITPDALQSQAELSRSRFIRTA